MEKITEEEKREYLTRKEEEESYETHRNKMVFISMGASGFFFFLKLILFQLFKLDIPILKWICTILCAFFAVVTLIIFQKDKIITQDISDKRRK